MTTEGAPDDWCTRPLIIAGESLAPPITGIGQYTRALIAALAEDLALTGLRIYDGRRLMTPETALAAATSPVRRAATMRRFFRRLPGLYELRQRLRNVFFQRLAAGAALYHEPNFILKPFAGPCVTTVHDLSHLVHPEFHPRERVRFLERHLPETLARASRILTVSNFSRAELINRLGVEPGKIVVTPLAAAQRFAPRDEEVAKPVLARYGLRWKRFVLSAATLEPRKNIAGLIAAYCRLPAAIRRTFPLALAGTVGWRENTFAAAIDELLKQGEAVKLGYVPDSDLPALMSACRCFAYLSFYEGFGLPLLEAQACGAVTVASANTALPEIAAPTCLLVEPHDIGAITAALRRALEDDALVAAARLAGPALAARYSWRATAQATFAAYRAALAQ